MTLEEEVAGVEVEEEVVVGVEVEEEVVSSYLTRVWRGATETD